MSVSPLQRRLGARRQGHNMQLVPVSASRGILARCIRSACGTNGIGKSMRAALKLSFCHGGDGLAIAGQGNRRRRCVSESGVGDVWGFRR